MEAVDDQPPLAINSALKTSSIEESYHVAVTAKENLQKTLSFHAQYRQTLSELKPFLTTVEDELNKNNLASSPEEKISRLQVRYLTTRTIVHNS